MRLETVKIKHPGGYSLINKAEYNKSIHELFEESNQVIPEKKTLKINTADKKALISLQGVGSKTADEIINARPFESLEDAIAKFRVLENLEVTL